MMGITPTAILVVVAAPPALAPPLPAVEAEALPAELLVPPHPDRTAPVTIASNPMNARRREGLCAMSPPGGMRCRGREIRAGDATGGGRPGPRSADRGIDAMVTRLR